MAYQTFLSLYATISVHWWFKYVLGEGYAFEGGYIAIYLPLGKVTTELKINLAYNYNILLIVQDLPNHAALIVAGL